MIAKSKGFVFFAHRVDPLNSDFLHLFSKFSDLKGGYLNQLRNFKY